MKHSLIALLIVVLGGCAALPSQPAAPGDARLANLAGDYDNHAQVWQAREAKTVLPPVHVHHRIVAVGKSAEVWDWQLRMDRPQGAPLEVSWRYDARVLADGRTLLTPARPLPVVKGGAAEFAPLAPCAMVGGIEHGVLTLATDIAACSAILPGLGAAGALLPVRLRFDGHVLDVATFADQPRGATASQHAVRARWFSGWVAINGAGPNAKADSQDWHLHRDLALHDQGDVLPLRWRDGKPSGYSIRLEQLEYQQRDTRVLKLSLLRDADGDAVAYAWANPDASQIGLNLGWVQVGLRLGGGDRH
ncbi:MAG TPA: hypothetical protein VFN09_14420 [Rhodanobacteraceae bacterium]|nr:hypothetical protein [Rhodanobacteraceae bacterium]